MNSSKDNFDAESSVGATMVETTNPVCDLSEFECDVSDEVLASIDESVFVNKECRVSDGNVNCVMKPVFNNCTVNFSFKKLSINFVGIFLVVMLYDKDTCSFIIQVHVIYI